MLDVGALTTAGAAFAAGLATGVHCVAMCGPVGCAVLGGAGQTRQNLVAGFGAYHAGRIGGYALWGALAGAIGSRALSGLGQGPALIAPWLLVGVIIAAVLRWDRLLPKFGATGRWYLRATRRVQRWPAGWRGLGLGLATPLLPCGPLYLLLTAALFTASAGRGALFGAAFAAGTIPLLALGQTAFLTLGKRLPPTVLRGVQIGIAGLAVALIIWRTLATGPAGSGICAL
ncbi:MAG: sulfite exporter TauE/SafE family protein [Opitutales bacterium]